MEQNLKLYTWPLQLQKHCHYPFYVLIIPDTDRETTQNDLCKLHLISKSHKVLTPGEYPLPFQLFGREILSLCSAGSYVNISTGNKHAFMELKIRSYPYLEQGFYLKVTDTLLVPKGRHITFNILFKIGTHPQILTEPHFYYEYAYVSEFKTENYPARKDLMNNLKNYANMCNMYVTEGLETFDKPPSEETVKDYIKKVQPALENAKYVTLIYFHREQLDNFRELIKTNSRLGILKYLTAQSHQISLHAENVYDEADMKILLDDEPEYKNYNYHPWKRITIADMRENTCSILLKPNGATGDGLEIFARTILDIGGIRVSKIIRLEELPKAIIKTLYDGPDYPWRPDWETYLKSGPCFMISLTYVSDLSSHNFRDPEFIAYMRSLIVSCRIQHKVIWTRNGYHCPENEDEQNLMKNLMGYLVRKQHACLKFSTSYDDEDTNEREESISKKQKL